MCGSTNAPRRNITWRGLLAAPCPVWAPVFHVGMHNVAFHRQRSRLLHGDGLVREHDGPGVCQSDEDSAAHNLRQGFFLNTPSQSCKANQPGAIKACCARSFPWEKPRLAARSRARGRGYQQQGYRLPTTISGSSGAYRRGTSRS